MSNGKFVVGQIAQAEQLEQLSKGCNLADIIAFDDLDKDGRLSINEFYLAFSKLYSKFLLPDPFAPYTRSLSISSKYQTTIIACSRDRLKFFLPLLIFFWPNWFEIRNNGEACLKEVPPAFS